eukprot:3326134-Pleurochrysis_carterae.AAC.1
MSTRAITTPGDAAFCDPQRGFGRQALCLRERQECLNQLDLGLFGQPHKCGDMKRCMLMAALRPLHVSAGEGLTSVVKFLIEEAKAEVNPIDRWGCDSRCSPRSYTWNAFSFCTFLWRCGLLSSSASTLARSFRLALLHSDLRSRMLARSRSTRARVCAAASLLCARSTRAFSSACGPSLIPCAPSVLAVVALVQKRQ